jgi:hypothetical protein
MAAPVGSSRLVIAPASRQADNPAMAEGSVTVRLLLPAAAPANGADSANLPGAASRDGAPVAIIARSATASAVCCVSRHARVLGVSLRPLLRRITQPWHSSR